MQGKHLLNVCLSGVSLAGHEEQQQPGLQKTLVAQGQLWRGKATMINENSAITAHMEQGEDGAEWGGSSQRRGREAPWIARNAFLLGGPQHADMFISPQIYELVKCHGNSLQKQSSGFRPYQ